MVKGHSLGLIDILRNLLKRNRDSESGGKISIIRKGAAPTAGRPSAGTLRRLSMFLVPRNVRIDEALFRM